jgi:acetyl-CoA synthetase
VNPENFKIAEENFTWYQLWDKVVEFDMAEAEIKWFTEAKLNIAKNCIDRHLNKRGDKTAIIFEPNDPSEEALHISYNELHQRVAKWQIFGTRNNQRRSSLYLFTNDPGISCFHFSLCENSIHSVVFAGFSALQ